MNTSLKLIGFFFGLLVNLSAAGQKQIMIFIPAELHWRLADVVWDSSRFVLTHSEPGTLIEFYNGVTQERLASCIKPDGPNNQAVKAMVPHIRDLTAHLLRKAPATSPSINQVHIPAIARTVQATADNEREIRVIVLGSLYFNDPHDPAANFGRGRVPNDGALNAGDEVAYGTADRLGALDGVRVDFGYSDIDLARRDLNEITRFWSIFWGQQGAVLTSCRPASTEAAKNALNGVTTPLTHRPLDTTISRVLILNIDGSAIDDGNGMTGIQGPPAPPVVVTPTTPEQEATNISPVTRALQEAANVVPLPRSGQLNIAAVWTSAGGNADVDLYVRPRADAQELYYSNKVTPEGRYLRDIRSTGPSRDDESWHADWECVEIGEGNLSTTTVWLNLYACTTNRVDGIVRVVFADRTVDVPFTFRNTPSKGKGSGMRSSHMAWRRIDLNESIFETSSGR